MNLIITGGFRSELNGGLDPLIFQSKGKYSSVYTFGADPREIPDVGFVIDYVNDAVSSGAYLQLDGDSTMLGNIDAGGFDLINSGGIKGADGYYAAFYGTGYRYLVDASGNDSAPIIDYSNASGAGVGINTQGVSGRYGRLHFNALTTSQDYYFPATGGTIALTSDIELHFKGKYASLAALQAAYPTADPGDYAIVAVVGDDDKQYIWDDDDADWIEASSTGGVQSFNGRIGVVMPASGDYDISDITNGFAADGSIPLAGDVDAAGYILKSVSEVNNWQSAGVVGTQLQLSDTGELYGYIIDATNYSEFDITPSQTLFSTQNLASTTQSRIQMGLGAIQNEVLSSGNYHRTYLNTNGFGFFTGNSDVYLRADNVNTTYTAQMPDKSADDVFAMMSDLSDYALSGTMLSDYGITDAYTKTASDARYLQLSGGTMTGALTLSADAVSSLQAVTLQQLQSYVTGLWDDRGNFTPSGSYPSASGSGAAGAILKGDIYTISGLGAGVTGTMGSKTVNDGDTVRALVDTPGQTNTNWAIGEGNLGYVPLSNVLNSAQIFVGNASNVAAGVSLTLNATGGAFALDNAGILTFPNAATGTRGLLTSTDWNTFNGKQSTSLASKNVWIGSVGGVAAAQSLTLNATAGTFDLSNGGVLTFPDAATGTRGLLNSTDWNTFNGKQSTALSNKKVWIGGAGGASAEQTLTLNATGGAFDLSNTGVLTFPDATSSARGFATAAQVADRVFTDKISISTAELQALFTTPKTLVAAPGVGKMIEILSITGRLVYGTTTYTGNTTLTFRYVGSAAAFATNSALIQATTTRTGRIVQTAVSGTSQQMVENGAFEVTITTGNPSSGNGSLDLYITYKIITL